MSFWKGTLTVLIIEAFLVFLAAVLPHGILRGLVLYMIVGVFLLVLLLAANAMANYSMRTRDPNQDR